MKKAVCVLLSLMLILATASAMAATELNFGGTRNVQIQKAGDNTVEDGVSPTTGMTLADLQIPDGFGGMAKTGRYFPALVQIDNAAGGIGNRAPIYGSYADIVYEGPLHTNGTTRLTFVFSDLYPSYVGPTRSARLQHLWLREEWDGALVYFGSSPYEETSVEREISRLKIRQNGILFDGIYGSKPWDPYRFRSEALMSPHDVLWQLADLMNDVAPANYVPQINHTFKFTDELPEGEEAEVIYIKWNTRKDCNSILEYYPEENQYVRYLAEEFKDISTDGENTYTELYPAFKLNEKLEHGQEITFSNVIIQGVEFEYLGDDRPMPVNEACGTGNAEYFIGGKHFSGVWSRDNLQSRTVFYDENGEEISLQRGHTLIVMFDFNTPGRSISFE